MLEHSSDYNGHGLSKQHLLPLLSDCNMLNSISQDGKPIEEENFGDNVIIVA